MTQDKDNTPETEENSDSKTNPYEIYEYDNTLKENKENLILTSTPPQHIDNNGDNKKASQNSDSEGGVLNKIKSYFSPKNDTSLRETIEEYIESEEEAEEDPLLSNHEKALLSNVLELRTMCASDVMIPRADIIGIPDDISEKELFSLLAEKQYSRFPVYKNTLDSIVGSIHIKDILTAIARAEEFDMSKLIRDIPIISPSMHVLDLLTQMRLTRRHLALVVDEFGGIDGLVAIGDLIEAIVGEIDDEHNLEVQPEMRLQNDGSVIADARYGIDEFVQIHGKLLNKEEREENDTLGGLMFFLAGRVPARGEVLKHSSGMIFEILDADPRRVKRLRIRDIPQPKQDKTDN